MSSDHVQTAIQGSDGWWHVVCDCGVVGASRPTNYEAWKVRLEHRDSAGVVGNQP